MKICIYSSHEYFKPFLEKANKGIFDLRLLPDSLRPETVDKAIGCTTISIFSKDDASALVLEKLHRIGIRFIALRSTGYNNVDLEKAQSLGIRVARVPAYSPHAIAEHAIALILALSRRLIPADNRVKQYNFDLNGLTGFNLGDQTVGIIGTGKIGAATIQMLHGFGCSILAYDIKPQARLKQLFHVQYVSLEELIQQSDIISLHVPLNKQTEYLIDAKRIQQMKQGVMLINTGRGKLLETKAAIAALKTKHIAYLGLDVYENEKSYFFEDHSSQIMQDDTLALLTTFPNVLLTGHQAFLTETALSNIATTTISNFKAFEKGEQNDNFLTD